MLHPQFESGSAALSKKDRKELDLLVKRLRALKIASISVTGHTDDRPISARLQRLYPDNAVLSQARASSVGNYLAQELNLAPGQITYAGKGPDEPVAGNDTEEGRSRNRRVELRIGVKRTVVLADIVPKKESSGAKAVATIGLRPGDTWPAEKSAPATTARTGMPAYDTAWLAAAAPGNAWLWPPEGYHPPIAATKVVLQHDPALTPRLILNGKPVDSVYFDGTDDYIGIADAASLRTTSAFTLSAWINRNALGAAAVAIEKGLDDHDNYGFYMDENNTLMLEGRGAWGRPRPRASPPPR